MGLVQDIKNQVRSSGSNKGKIVYFKPDSKVRFRFLEELDDGRKFMFHDSYEKGINTPCRLIFDKDCKYCEDDSLRHRDNYVWQVFDYDANEVKLLVGVVNNFSPIPQFVGFYETYGNITDRDYVVNRTGKQMNTTYSVIPMDKVKFKVKAKLLSESKIVEILQKAFPVDEEEDDEPIIKKSKRKPIKKVEIEEDDEDDIDEADEDEDEENEDYEDMSSKELFNLCKKRGIKAKPKKKQSYYIDLLEEFDEDEEDEEDEW